MASLRLLLLVFLPLLLLLSPKYVASKDGEEELLDRINDHRKNLNLPTLSENDNAACLADEIAEEIEDQPCRTINITGPDTQFSTYSKQLSKCDLNQSTIGDGVLLLDCSPDKDSSALFNSTKFSQYLNASKFTGAGIGKEKDWGVVVLTTNSPQGSFEKTSAAFVLPIFPLAYTLVVLGLSLALLG